jgi:glycogen(starch) synthase
VRITLLPSAYAPAVGGVEELTRCLAAELVAEGHEVEAWVNRHPAELADREEIGGVTVRRFRMVLPAATPRSLLRYPRDATAAVRAMARATRQFRPDVLHVQCFSVNGVYAAGLARMFCIPLVISLQGETAMDDHDIYERSVSLRLGLRFGLRTASFVTGCSQFVLDDAARFGLAPQGGIVVPNGVEAGDAAEAEPVDLPFSRFVLAVGRVVEKKGFDLLINAFARITHLHPGLGLLIGGDGPARSALKERVAAAGLEDRVVLPGHFNRGNVRWATSNASVFVLPSRLEPFGIVVLEAMLAGLPTIVTTRGGAGEIVRAGIDGLIVDPFDSEALAGAIDSVLTDEALRSRLIASARERVRGYGWPTVTARYLELYRSASIAQPAQ